jgi:hypothetical protein
MWRLGCHVPAIHKLNDGRGYNNKSGPANAEEKLTSTVPTQKPVQYLPQKTVKYLPKKPVQYLPKNQYSTYQKNSKVSNLPPPTPKKPV